MWIKVPQQSCLSLLSSARLAEQRAPPCPSSISPPGSGDSPGSASLTPAPLSPSSSAPSHPKWLESGVLTWPARTETLQPTACLQRDAPRFPRGDTPQTPVILLPDTEDVRGPVRDGKYLLPAQLPAPRGGPQEGHLHRTPTSLGAGVLVCSASLIHGQAQEDRSPPHRHARA